MDEPPRMRNSIRSTYDSRESGDRYHVSYAVNGKYVKFMEPIPDPFVRATLTIGWRDILRALVSRGRVVVQVTVGGDSDVVADVMELDDNTLVPNSTRRAAFDSHINERLGDASRMTPSPSTTPGQVPAGDDNERNEF